MSKSLVLLCLILALAFSRRLPSHELGLTEFARELQHQADTTPVPSTVAPQQKPKQLVSNPLALNIIIEDREKVAQELKQRLDNQNVSYQACPIETPFFNGESCIKCFNYYNVNQRACVTCPSQTVYNKDTFRCQKILYLPNLEGENLLVGDRKLADWGNFQKRLIQINPFAIVRCPIETPHLINDVCGKCGGEKELYDLNSGTCDKCSGDETYDKEDRKCLSKKLITGLSDIIPSIVPVSVPTIAAVPVAVTATSVQNSTAPVAPVVVTPVVATVTAPPTPTPTITVLAPVDPTRPAFLTNPDTYGLILDNETLEQYRARYNLLKSQGVDDCPNATGYFDGKQCVGCPGNDSKFLQSTKKCTRCPKGTWYKYAIRNCVPE